MANIEERLAKKEDVEKLALIVEASSDERLKVTCIIKMEDEKFAYQLNYKVSRELLDQSKTVLDQFLAEIRQTITDVMAGKRELTAVV